MKGGLTSVEPVKAILTQTEKDDNSGTELDILVSEAPEHEPLDFAKELDAQR